MIVICIRVVKQRKMTRVEHAREKRDEYRVLVGKPEYKKPLGRRRSRWQDNNKMYIKEMLQDSLDSFHLDEGRN